MQRKRTKPDLAAGECRDYPDTKRLALRLANLDIGPNVPKFPSEPKEVNLQAAEGMAGIVHHGDPNTIVIESIEDELKDEYQQDKTERDGTLALNIPLPPIRPAIQELPLPNMSLILWKPPPAPFALHENSSQSKNDVAGEKMLLD